MFQWFIFPVAGGWGSFQVACSTIHQKPISISIVMSLCRSISIKLVWCFCLDEFVLYIHWYSVSVAAGATTCTRSWPSNMASMATKWPSSLAERRPLLGSDDFWLIFDVFWWGSDDCVNLDGDVFRKMLICRHQLTVDPMRLLGMWLGPQWPRDVHHGFEDGKTLGVHQRW